MQKKITLVMITDEGWVQRQDRVLLPALPVLRRVSGLASHKKTSLFSGLERRLEKVEILSGDFLPDTVE